MELKVTQEVCLLFWKDGELKAIERKNGSIERHMTEPATWASSVQLFEAGNAENPKN